MGEPGAGDFTLCGCDHCRFWLHAAFGAIITILREQARNWRQS